MSPKGMTHERIKMWLNEQPVRNLPRRFATNPETTAGYGLVRDVGAGEALEPMGVPGFALRLAAVGRFEG